MWKQRFLQTFAMMSLISLQTMAAGFLQIDGVVSDAAIVGKAKAVRCNIQLYSSGAGIKKNGCDFKNSYILDLNQSYALPEGLYLVGYENTLYPGIIEIRENQNTKLQLNEVSIGAEFAGKQVKMYRDFAHPIEQKKMMLTHYGLGRSFFLMTENEGEYQLRIPFFKEILAHIDYRGCEIVNKRAVGENTFRIERSDSIRICKSMSSANTFLDYREVFDFSEDGTITEM